jgi:hypothetical protein
MRLGRSIGWSALLAAATLAAAELHAQTLDDARDLLGFPADIAARSVRLQGLGRLTLPGGDVHNRIALWDFALNPIGILDADSVSTFELRPATNSLSNLKDVPGTPPQQKQELAARESRLAFEGWRRAGGIAYGVIGDGTLLRLDRPVTADLEERTTFEVPNVMGVLAGAMPYIKSGHVSYALRAFVGRESGDGQFRTFVSNPTGQYIDGDGATIPPSNFFNPDEEHVTTLGGGAALSYRWGRSLTASALGDLVNREVLSQNDGDRYDSEVRGLLRGKRPYPIGGATLIGRIGRNFEWGWDGRIWNRRVEERWAFTVSAGIGQNPLVGRGKYADLDQNGSSMRARARWTLGGLELGGSLGTDYLKGVEAPPAPGDPSSFNSFLDVVYRRPNADTLSLPDSVSFARTESRAWTAAGGATLQLPGRRGLIGVEYHAAQREFDGAPRGLGPRQTEWDVRGGVEYRCTPVLAGRAGYIYRKLDLDELTRDNEQLTETMTLGLGLGPTGASWQVDVAYGIEWWWADYGDPTLPRGNRQNVTGQLRWAF